MDGEKPTEVSKVEHIEVDSRAKKQFGRSRRSFLREGLSLATGIGVAAVLPENAFAQNTINNDKTPDFTPIPDKPREIKPKPDHIQIDSDASDKPRNMNKEEAEAALPVEFKNEIKAGSAFARKFIELSTETELEYRQGQSTNAEAYYNSHVNKNATGVEIDSKVVLFFKDLDKSSLDYAKLTAGMALGELINDANNDLPAEHFKERILEVTATQNMPGIDISTPSIMTDRRLSFVLPLFSIPEYIPGPAQDFDDMTSDNAESLFARSFSLITFKRNELLEKLDKMPTNEKKLAASILLASVEAMMDFKDPKVLSKDLKMDELIGKLVHTAEREPKFAKLMGTGSYA